MLVGCVCVPKLYDNNHRLISSLASLTTVYTCIHVYKVTDYCTCIHVHVLYMYTCSYLHIICILVYHNVVVHVYSRCSSHPLQCDGSSGEAEEVVERGGGTGLLAPHISVKAG